MPTSKTITLAEFLKYHSIDPKDSIADDVYTGTGVYTKVTYDEAEKMPTTPVPTFKEKHYIKLAGIIARSMQSVNKEVDPRHHEAVFKAVTIIVNRMVTELAEDNKLFNKGLFIKSITDASKPSGTP